MIIVTKRKRTGSLTHELERYPEYYFEEKIVWEAKARAQERAETKDAEIAAEEAMYVQCMIWKNSRSTASADVNQTGPVKVLLNGMEINTGSGEF